MSSLARDLVPLLLLAALVLGAGLGVGLLVWLVGRFESWRIRRGLAEFAATMTDVHHTPAPIGPAWKLHGVEGTRAGCRIRLSFDRGTSLPPAGAGSGPTTLRALVSYVEVRPDADGSLDAPDELAPPPTAAERARWVPRIAVDGSSGLARFAVDPPRTAADAADVWAGVRVAAEALRAQAARARGPA